MPEKQKILPVRNLMGRIIFVSALTVLLCEEKYSLSLLVKLEYGEQIRAHPLALPLGELAQR